MDDRQTELVQVCSASLARLKRLVGQLLELNDLDRDRVKLEITRFDPRELARAAVAHGLAGARAKGIDLTLALPVGGPLLVEGDAARIRSCLLELIDNAVAFTAPGAVAVRCRSEVDASGATLLYEVDDDGPGVEQADIEALFSAFSQADESGTRSHEGAGVGLTVCRAMARRMGGDAGLRNRGGGGATAWLTVPVVCLSG